MAEQFLETDHGFINVRLIARIWWDKETDGWALEHSAGGGRAELVAYPKDEGAVQRLLGLDEFGG